jgi:predicted O-linked N-acetylglucosamine transferase (SPINDLY family)
VQLISRAIEKNPNQSLYYHHLGNAFLELGHPDKAITNYQKALAIKPDLIEALYNLGNIFQEMGQLDQAVTYYQKVLSSRPDLIEAHNNLGNTLKEMGQLDQAVACYQKVLSSRPDLVEARNNLGNIFQEMGQLDQAVACYQKVLTSRPDLVEARNNLGNTFKEMGQLDQAVACYQEAISQKTDFYAAHSNLLLILNYQPDIIQQEIYDESLKWDQRHAQPLLPDKQVFNNSKESGRRLRIGYVSQDFRNHSVAYFFEPLIKAHNRKHFEIFCYANVLRPDEATERIKNTADHWTSIVGKNNMEAAELIKEDKIDILVDLAGHTGNNRLMVFAYKPAPIQVTWLGYPNTTGIQAIDYRLTDDVADPVGGADTLHSEKLVRLKKGFLCYQPIQGAPAVSPLPILDRGYITFGSFNNITKTTTEVVRVWSEILLTVPKSHLVLKCRQFADKVTRERYKKLFGEQGITADRIRLFSRLPKPEDHLNLYSDIDIGLDPFPYNGTTTTCEALWMGVPVVTMLGDRHSGRVGASIMHQVGLEDQLVADDANAYVKNAVDLSKNINRLAKLRQAMRKQILDSSLCDAEHYVSGNH